MKKVLLASTALVVSAGIAAADVSVGGSGRMGIIGGGTDNTTTTGIDETDLSFTSRIRISFSASGETDAGLSFGGSTQVHHGNGGNLGTDGEVFIEGSFGKISMGDVSGAPEAAIGDLSGVGLTGLSDYNELTYLSNSDRPAARWDYTTGDLGLHVSADNPGSDDAALAPLDPAYGIAVTYGMGDISFGLGMEDNGAASHIVAGVTAGFGDATVKVVYGTADDLDFTQMGVSVDYVTGATTVTAFWINKEIDAGVVLTDFDADSFGLGVSYDLGGGASIKAGYVDSDFEDDALYDFGISMSF